MDNRNLEHLKGFELASSDYGDFLGSLIKYNRCRTVVEIGVAYGTTTPYLCQGVLDSDQWNEINKTGMVYGFDIWTNTGKDGFAIQLGDYDFANEYIKNKGYSNYKLTRIDTRSEEFRNKLKELAPIDFVFIDGDHSYNGTKNDFEKVYDYLAPNGIIAFHDTFRCDGSREFVHDLRTKGYDGTFDMVNLPWGNRQYKCGLTLLFKRCCPIMNTTPVDLHGSVSSPEEIKNKEFVWLNKEKENNKKIIFEEISKEITSVWNGTGDVKNGYEDTVLKIWLRVNWFLSLIEKSHDLKKIKTILDVGSLNGIEAVFFSYLLPWADVHSFDVSPIAVQMIKDNQKNRKNCHFHQTAISNIIGETQFWIPKINWGAASILKPTGGYAGLSSDCSLIKVPCTTIKQWANEQGIKSVELLWVDLQGNELNALKGMENLIDNVVGLHSEIGLEPYYEGHQLYPEINQFLELHGFKRDESLYPYVHNEGDLEKDMVYIRRG